MLWVARSGSLIERESARPRSAGDLLMVQVLRRLNGSGLLEEYPNLSAYVASGEARPALKRAFDAQLAVLTAKPLAAQ